jgi:subtilisin
MVFKVNAEVLEIQEEAPQQSLDWGVSLVQAPQVWRETRGEGIKVLVLDTGIDYRHPDLAFNFRNGANFTSSDMGDVLDRQGHGTHCAGIIAGLDNNFGIVGVAPRAQIYAAKVLDDDGAGDVESVIKGIDYGIRQDVDIISMSLGTTKDPGEELRDACKRAREAGIIIIAASGNESSTVGYPAAYPEVLAVGAIDQALESAEFSNFGPELDISAPGVDILSTYLNGSYAKLSGTSMATPMVTGVVALLQSYGRKHNLDTTPQKIVELIATRSVDIGDEGRDDSFGNGFINVYKLLKNKMNSKLVDYAEEKVEIKIAENKEEQDAEENTEESSNQSVEDSNDVEVAEKLNTDEKENEKK